MYTYKEIVNSANIIKKNVETKYELGASQKWSYYFAKAILTQKSVSKLTLKDATKPTGSSISRQIDKADYIDMAKRLVNYVENNKQIPNYISYKEFKISTPLFTYIFARILVYFNNTGLLPNYAEANTKAFVKPSETTNEVYNYFIDVFGKFDNTIDGALSKIASKGYGYYYDDKYSNKEAIQRMKQGKGVNCTDSCQVFYNIALVLIKKGKYKKVEAIHIKCKGGDGHIRLRITMNDGTYIYRDPASVLNGNGIRSNWCMNGTLLAINPSWFMQNLNR